METNYYSSSDYRYAARIVLSKNWKHLFWAMLILTVVASSFVKIELLASFSVWGGYDLLLAISIGPYMYSEVVGHYSASFSGIGSSPFLSPVYLLILLFFGIDIYAFPYLTGGLFPVFLLALALSVLLFLFTPMLVQGKIAILDCMYGQRPFSVRTLFSRYSYYLRALWLRLIMTAFCLLWGMLLVIPGIIAYYRYSMAPYLLYQNPEMRAIDALRESKRIMAGNKKRLFFLHMSYLGWSIAAVILTMILSNTLVFSLWSRALAWGLTILLYTPLNSYRSAGEYAFFLSLCGRLQDAPALVQ